MLEPVSLRMIARAVNRMVLFTGIILAGLLGSFAHLSPAQAASKVKGPVAIMRRPYECELRIALRSQHLNSFEIQVHLAQGADAPTVSIIRDQVFSMPSFEEDVAIVVAGNTYRYRGDDAQASIRKQAPATFLDDLGRTNSVILFRNASIAASALLNDSTAAVQSLRHCASRNEASSRS